MGFFSFQKRHQQYCITEAEECIFSTLNQRGLEKARDQAGTSREVWKRQEKGRGSDFPKSLLCMTVFFKTNHLFTRLLKCCIFMTPLLASIVIHTDSLKRPFGSLQVGFTVCFTSCLLFLCKLWPFDHSEIKSIMSSLSPFLYQRKM